MKCEIMKRILFK